MFVNDKITCKLVKTPKNENEIMFNMFLEWIWMTDKIICKLFWTQQIRLMMNDMQVLKLLKINKCEWWLY